MLSDKAKQAIRNALADKSLANELINEIEDNNETLQESKDYTDAQITAVINAAPAALDTLNELAAALNDDENFASTVTNLISTKEDAGVAQEIMDTHESAVNPHPQYASAGNFLVKGTKTRFCIDNGDYATLQAAVDASSSGDVILVGPKGSSWGDVTIPAQKKLSIVGLQAPYGLDVEVGAITYSPTTGTNQTINDITISRLFINKLSGVNASVTYGGTATSRLRIYESYIFAGTLNSAVVVTNSHASSAFYMEDFICGCSTGNTTMPMINLSSVYAQIKRGEIFGGSKAILLNSGTAEITLMKLEYTIATEIVNIAGGTMVMGNCLIINHTTNGDGIKMITGSVLSIGDTTFNIPAGTGYCIRGVGTMLYGRFTFFDSGAGAGNKKVQNTVTALPLTTTFTSVA